MLSIEDPSCSSKASDLAAGHETPKFSIRDYVFKSRRKDIRINWPFRKQLLKVCLDNGISDLLPPLQPPSVVKNICLGKEVECEPLPKYLESKTPVPNEWSKEDDIDRLESTLPLDSTVLLSSDLSQHPLPKKRSVVLKICRKGLQDSKRTLLESETINASSVISHDLSGVSGEQLRKKCRLAVKLCTGKETRSAVDLITDPITVSDPMATKVCPVCKSFSSTSNTTLNAHIDQCLSSDPSNATRDVIETQRLKVKPTKKRFMVDIYKTALHCTLEDLDRRNGTNWAASLTPVVPADDSNEETKRTKFALLPLENDISMETRSSRIALSPPSDNINLGARKAKCAFSLPANDIDLDTGRAKFDPSDAVSAGKVGDIYVDSNGTKLLILSKFNDNPPLVSRKNLKLRKHGKGLKEVRSCSVTENKFLKPKRSKFLKDNPPNKKISVAEDGEIDPETKVDLTADSREKVESTSQLLNANGSVENSEPSTLGHWVCSKRSDLSRKFDNKDNSKGSDKLVVASRKLSFRCDEPTPASIQGSRPLELPSSSSDALASPKTKNMNTLSNSMSAMDREKKISPQASKLRSRLYLRGKSLADAQLSRRSSSNERSHPSLKAIKSLVSERTAFSRSGVSVKGMEIAESDGFIAPQKYKKHRSAVYGRWKGEKKSGASERIDGSNVSSGGNETRKIHQPSTLTESQQKNSFSGTDPARNSVVVTPTDVTNLDTVLSYDPTPEDDVESNSRDETLAESPGQKSTDNQEMQCEDVISNEAISRDDQAEPILQHEEFEAAIRGPSSCTIISSDGETGLENIEWNSSTTSVDIRVESDQDQNVTVNMESSGSAVSSTSTISSPSPVDDNHKNSEADQLPEDTEVQDKFGSPIARKENIVKSPPSVKEPSCSCIESLSRESQFPNHVRKSTASNLFIKPPPPRILPSLQGCSSLESHTESILTTDSTKSSVNASTPCSRVKSASNPVLRLMGKDLVVGKEEHVQLPAVYPCDSNYSQEAKFISFGVPNNVGFASYNNTYHYQFQDNGSQQIPLQPIQSSYMFNSPSQYNMDRMVFAPYQHQPPHQHWPRPIIPSVQAQEVILIDDDSHRFEAGPRTSFTTLPQTLAQDPNPMAAQRMFACFPLQNPHVLRSFTSGQREAPRGPYMFPTPSSLYFSQTLR